MTDEEKKQVSFYMRLLNDRTNQLRAQHKGLNRLSRKNQKLRDENAALRDELKGLEQIILARVKHEDFLARGALGFHSFTYTKTVTKETA